MSGGVVGPIRGEAGPVREGDAVRLTPFDLPFEKAPGLRKPRLSRARSGSFGAGGDGKMDLKLGATFGAIAADDGASVLLNDAVASAQTQTSPLSHGTRGVEGIENAIGFGDAGSVITVFKNDDFALQMRTHRERGAFFRHGV